MTGPARITFTLDDWAVFDGTNEARIRDVAGEQFLERAGDAVVVQSTDGRPERLTAGWVVYRVAGPDGKPAERATVCGPGAWKAMGGPQVA